MMQVVPVIDVRGGVAVAAQRGDRARYRPLQTPLAASADPVAVAQGLMSLFPFQTLYVADLDGIEGRGADLATQYRLATAWSGREVWIDDGSAGRSRDPLIKSQLPYQTTKCHVLGSESQTSLAEYETAREAAGPSAPLSLDFRGDDFIGPREILDDEALWPDRVIVMTLARVGSSEGPDLARLKTITARAGARKVYAAGGVRNVSDLRALSDIGVAGALVATVLHNGSITRAELEALPS